jgi:hypothetical protein
MLQADVALRSSSCTSQDSGTFMASLCDDNSLYIYSLLFL